MLLQNGGGSKICISFNWTLTSESKRTFYSVTVGKLLFISANQNLFWEFLDKPVDPTWPPPVALRRTGEGHISGGEWSPARHSGSHQNGAQWTGSWRLETRSEHLLIDKHKFNITLLFKKYIFFSIKYWTITYKLSSMYFYAQSQQLFNPQIYIYSTMFAWVKIWAKKSFEKLNLILLNYVHAYLCRM